MLYHAHATEDVLKEFETSEKGLHHIYAEARLVQHGRNTIRLARRSLWKVVSEPFANIFMLILTFALLLSVLSLHFVEAALITFTITVSLALHYFQSLTHERTLRSIERSATASARVRRDGIEVDIDPAELVPGDIVLLAAGDRIPADGRVLHAQQLRVNESQLSGHAASVGKSAQLVHSDAELPERSSMLYLGTFVLTGTAQYIITATGNDTEYGLLTSIVKKAEQQSTLQSKIERFTSTLTLIALSGGVVVLILSLARGVSYDDALESLIAIIVAAIPANLPIAMSIIIALGLKKLYTSRALLRSMRTIESTSMLSTLAFDKTGLLLRDRLEAREHWSIHNTTRKLLDIAHRSVLPHQHDTHDQAIAEYIANSGHKTTKMQPAKIFEFHYEVGISGNLWHQGDSYLLAVKGAPEKILHRADMTESEKEQAIHKLHQLTKKGSHVIALAHVELSQPITQLSKLPKRTKLTFDGYIAFRDHLRADAKQAIQQAQRAGITVRMMTGDHVETAFSIAKRLGIVATPDEILDSRKLALLSDAELQRITRNTKVFARTSPDQKQRLLMALKRHDIVAMTGDTIEDVPALTHAHVGISSQQSAAVARDASDIILLNNNFSTTLEAIKQSRTVLGNMRRMLQFILIVNLSELAIVLLSLLFGLPAALLPVQILWINLTTSISLAIPLGLEPHSRNIMKRNPVKPTKSILPKYLIARIALMVVVAAAVSVSMFSYFFYTQGLDYARSIAFYTLIMIQIANAFVARSDHTSTLVRLRTFSGIFYVGLFATIALQLLTVATPLASLLGLTAVTTYDLLWTGVAAVAAPVAAGELSKLYSRHSVRRKGESY